MQAIFIKAKISPRVMERAGSLSREALHEYVEYQEARIRALSQHRSVPSPPVENAHVRSLYGSISAGMRTYWGSNEERSAARADLFAMQLQYGQPTIFFTFSPDSSSSYRIAHLAGEVSDDVLKTLENCVNSSTDYSRVRLGEIASSNPFICAKYFNALMTIFIDVILNWDRASGSARSMPGIFGHTKAFFAATESQNSTGSLHSHMLVWVESMPSTVDEYYSMCVSQRFKQAMGNYVDAIASSSVPLDLSDCPACEAPTIKAVPFHQQAFMKPSRGSERPVTAECGACGSKYGADELIKQHVAKRKLHQPTNADVVRHICSSRPLNTDGSPTGQSAIIATEALLQYQHHHWFHSKSCFKITKRTPRGDVCRMFMPKEPCATTHWTTDQRIQVKRQVGNEYINTYIPAINSVFTCNHDVKFLGAGEGVLKRHITSSSTRQSINKTSKTRALHIHAFDKSEQRGVGREQDAAAKGRRRVQSMCCTLSNPHEVSAPMASLYLIRGSAMYTSHEFIKLNLAAVMNTMFQEDEDVEIVLEGDENDQNFKPCGLWIDCIHRPPSLDGMCLMAFTATYQRIKSLKGQRFLQEHPHFRSHSLVRYSKPRLVTVCHKRLPDTRGQSLEDDEQLRFRRSMMVLFHPFLSRNSFVPSDTSFEAYFRAWWNGSAPESAKEFVKNNNDYYASRELVRNLEDPESARYFTYEGDAYGMDPDDGIDTSSEEAFEPFELSDFDDASLDLEPCLLNAIHPTQYIDLLERTPRATELVARACFSSSEFPTISMTPENARVCLQEPDITPPTPTQWSDSTSMASFPDVHTRVRMLERALDPSSALSPDTQQSNENDCRPSLHSVSRLFNLNSKQEKMFILAGTSLLRSILAGHDSSNQMIGFLGGLPGAGKSRVIAAVQYLAGKWGAANAVATAAYQGIAAQAANGQTIHKLFGYYVASDRKWTPTRKQRTKFAPLRLLILDEISTCDAMILGLVDSSLRTLMKNESSVFGGVHVLLVGDWLQQLPVAGQPAYLSLNELLRNDKKKARDAYLNRVRGITAYKAINTVVILTENMRHKGDQVWRDILDRLDRWRVGIFEQRDVDLVNQIAYIDNWARRECMLQAYCPIIVTSNALRVEFNSRVLRTFCRDTRSTLHRFRSSITRSRGSLTGAQMRSLEHIRDDKTSGMPIIMEITIGAKVQCTKNVSTRLKLANGSIGTVVGFIPAANDVVEVRFNDGIEEKSHSLPPEVVFAKIEGFENCSFSNQLPLGVVPVCPRLEKVTIEIGQRSFSVSITQVPLVPAYALTTEKCQGLTVEKMVLGPMRHTTRRVPQRSSFYVAVTRVKSLQHLYLMAPLTLEYLRSFSPRRDALEECDRLRSIEDAGQC